MNDIKGTMSEEEYNQFLWDNTAIVGEVHPRWHDESVRKKEEQEARDSAKTNAICRAGYGNLDSLHVERVLRENAKKP